MAKYQLYIRKNSDLSLVGVVDDYLDLSLTRRYNDVGAWSLTVRAGTPAAALLTTANGLIVQRDSGDGTGFHTILSGPVQGIRREGTSDNLLIASGPDDMFWLQARLALPVVSGPPYSGSAYDTRTGTCSTVLIAYVKNNLGSLATTARKLSVLSLAADPGIGTSVTGNARFDNLLTLLQQLASSGGDLGFTLMQSGSNLVFTVYQPVTVAKALFSTGMGNLFSYVYEIKPPTANYDYCGGGGVGTARTFRESGDSTSISTYGQIEGFVDARDTTDTGTMDQRITADLLQQKQRTSLTITPIDTPSLTFGRDYNLGDKVSVLVDGTTITDVVREVALTLTAQDGDVITPGIGTPGNVDTQVWGILGGLRRVTDNLTNRVASLETVQ